MIVKVQQTKQIIFTRVKLLSDTPTEASSRHILFLSVIGFVKGLTEFMDMQTVLDQGKRDFI